MSPVKIGVKKNNTEKESYFPNNSESGSIKKDTRTYLYSKTSIPTH